MGVTPTGRQLAVSSAVAPANIDGVHVKPLKLIADERGYLMEMLRVDDPFFSKFGQAYVSATYPGVVKACFVK